MSTSIDAAYYGRVGISPDVKTLEPLLSHLKPFADIMRLCSTLARSPRVVNADPEPAPKEFISQLKAINTTSDASVLEAAITIITGRVRASTVATLGGAFFGLFVLSFFQRPQGFGCLVSIPLLGFGVLCFSGSLWLLRWRGRVILSVVFG